MRRRPSDLGPAAANIAQRSHELAPVVDRGERRLGHERHDRRQVTLPVTVERPEVGVGVGEQPRRDRDGDVSGDASREEQGVYECPTSAAVAVHEGVDRFELGVSEGGVYQRRNVVAGQEPHQVVDRGGDAVVVRGHERRLVRPVVTASDPDLFGAPPSGDIGMRPPHERGVHREEGVGVQPVGEVDGGTHGTGVGDDLGGVTTVVVSQFGQCDGPGRRGETLDSRGRRRFRPQQHRTEGGDGIAHLRIEPGDLDRCPDGARHRRGWGHDIVMGDGGKHRRPVRPLVPVTDPTRDMLRRNS